MLFSHDQFLITRAYHTIPDFTIVLESLYFQMLGAKLIVAANTALYLVVWFGGFCLKFPLNIAPTQIPI